MPQSQPSSQDRAAPHATDDLAAALGRIPSGLFVVTWRDDGRDRGMLASWVMQAGFEPPSITIAVAPNRGLLTAIRAGAPFVVNVLAEHQRPLLARFGRPADGDDPFAGIEVDRRQEGAATIRGTAAWLECRAVAPPEADLPGDHAVVLARVIAASAATDLAPLVHVRKNGLRY